MLGLSPSRSSTSFSPLRILLCTFLFAIQIEQIRGFFRRRRRRTTQPPAPCGAGKYGAGIPNCNACEVGKVLPQSKVNERKPSCDACAQGRTSDDGLLCYDCAAGTYNRLFTGSSCVDCPMGYSATDERSVGCSLCEVGKSQYSTGQPVCGRCQAGFYQAEYGQSECNKCALGFYQSSQESTSCNSCASGQYASSKGSSTCAKCAVGKYAAYVESTACPKCPSGYAAANERSSSCNGCQTGRFSNSEGASSCSLCPTGLYSNEIAMDQCTSCEAGLFTSQEGQSQCSDCRTGQFSSDEGSTSCNLCPGGKYQTAQGQQDCVSCTKGQYQSVEGSVSCLSCAAGYYSDQAESSSCDSCSPGKYLGETRGTACLECELGQFTSSDGQIYCEDCAAGKYLVTRGQSSCDECDAGKYSSGVRNTVCTSCSNGRASAAGAYECGVCSPGKYQAVAGTGTCQNCDAGKSQAVAASSDCDSCLAGYFSDLAGMASCLECPAGKFATGAGSTACQLCGAGQYSTGVAAVSCNLCAPGKHSLNGECAECDKGTFSQAGQGSCDNCAAGKFIGRTGSDVCLVCPNGFSSTLGSISCEACAPGKVATQGASSCNECAAGMYQPDERKETCLECAPGSSQPKTGRPTCLLCEAGLAQSKTGQSDCDDCAAGKFATTLGNLQCELCALGKVTETPGQALCTECAEGEFTSTIGSSSCSSCSPGQVVATSGACVSCVVGRYSNTPGASECAPCAKGKFAAAAGSALCTECQAGQYAADTTYTKCKICDVGKHASNTGAATCSTCAEGKFADTTGAADCTNCARGTYTEGEAAHTVCKICSAGTSASVEGAKKCDLCDPGSAAEFPGSVGCQECSVGKFVQVAGGSVCEKCVKGTAATTPGTKSCALCIPGKHSYAKGLSQCYDCPGGKVSSSSGTVTCTECLAGEAALPGKEVCTKCVGSSGSGVMDGTYQDKKGQSECEPCGAPVMTGAVKCGDGACSAGTKTVIGLCEPCPRGKWQDQRNQPACTNCPKGYYSGDNYVVEYQDSNNVKTEKTFGADHCVACTEGKYGLLALQWEKTTCTDCPAGRWSGSVGHAPASASAACSNCPIGRYGTVAGIIEMSNCPECLPGKFNTQSGSSSENDCVLCDAGKYSTEIGAGNAGQCLECGNGKYQPTQGTTKCFDCQLGRSVSGGGADTCVDCSKGEYSDEEGLATCKLSPLGSYVSGWVAPSFTGGTSSAALRLGSHGTECANFDKTTDATGCTGISVCPAGWFGETPTSTGRCETCPAGKRSDKGKTECEECGAGSFTETSGSSICSDCPKGWRSASTVSDKCTICAAGTYAPGQREIACTDCQEGQYTGTPGQVSCVVCPIGYVQKSAAKSVCDVCEAGKRQAPLQMCQDCEAGYFQPAPGLIECTICPNGYVEPATGGVSCTQCLAGMYMVSTQNPCEDCAVGYYQPDDTSVSCKKCAPGKVQADTKQIVCKDCLAGFFAAKQAQTLCHSCLPGTFAEYDVSGECLACPKGWIQKSREGKSCDKCDVATFQIDQDCQPCSPGTYSTEDAVADKCTDCPAGYVGEELESTSCDACEIGKYVGIRGSRACIFCQKGKYGNANATTVCTDCPRGFVQQYTGEITCVMCKIGEQSNDKDQTCDLCLSGTFAAAEGSEKCDDCPTGWKQPLTGQAGCDICSAGRHADKDTMATKCIKCPSGFFGPESGKVKCESCPSGWFQKDPRQIKCDVCQPGKEAKTDSQAVECSSCEPGFFAPTAASFNDNNKMNLNGTSNGCRVCPSGWYQENMVQAECFECAIGKRIADVLSPTDCDFCTPGKYNNQLARERCIGCPSGWQQGAEGMDSCAMCRRGKYATTVTAATEIVEFMATDCKACPAGYFGANDAHALCEQCPYGFFQKDAEETRCVACEMGTETGPTHIDNRVGCDHCSAGQFSESIGLLADYNEIIKNTLLPATTLCGLTCQLREANCKKNYLCCVDCPKGFFQGDDGKHECTQCEPGKFSPPGASECGNQPKDIEMDPPRLKSLRPISRDSNLMSLEMYLNHKDFFAMGSTTETKRNGPQGTYDRLGILIQWSSVDAAKHFPDLNARPVWLNLKCGETVVTYFKGTTTIMDSVYFFCIALPPGAEESMLAGVSEDEDPAEVEKDIAWRRNYLEGVYKKYVELHKARFPPNSTESVVTPETDLIINVTIPAALKGPVWDNSVFLRAAYLTSTSTTSSWTKVYGGTPSTNACKNTASRQEYLRTHPKDDTCQLPIDLLQLNATETEKPGSQIECIKCPPGGNCLTEANTLKRIVEYRHKKGARNPMNRFDVGAQASPALGDMDGDGDSDMYVGNSEGKLLYFQSVGVTDEPEYQEMKGELNPMNEFVVAGFAKPVLADIDHDGDLDMFVGSSYFSLATKLGVDFQDKDVRLGKISYFENTGNATVASFTQRTGADNPLDDVSLEDYVSLAVSDLDQDDDLDIFVGNSKGYIAYFENMGGNSSIPVFIERYFEANPMENIQFGDYANIALSDIDEDGDIDLFGGNSSGVVLFYENLGEGKHDPSFKRASWLVDFEESADVGSFASLTLSDIDGDGDIDLFAGNSYGKTQYFKNTAISAKLNGERVPAPGLFVWDVGKLEKYWRIPWAPVDGERINQEGEHQRSPYWFHPCPRSGTCIGVHKEDAMGGFFPATGDGTNGTHRGWLGGWNNDVSDNAARQWTCPDPHPAPRCKIGTGGPLCANCIDNWTRIQGECRMCYTIEARLIMICFVTAFVLGVAVLLKKVVKRCRKYHGAFKDTSRICIVGLNLAQIMVAAKTMVPVPWPPILLWFFEQLDFVNLDITSMTGATCNKEVNFHVQFLAMAVIPLVIIIVLFMQFVNGRRRLRKRMAYLRQSEHKELLDKAIENCHRELFDLIDADNSGTLTTPEVINLLKLIGYHDKATEHLEEEIIGQLIASLCNSRFASQISRSVFLKALREETIANTLDRIHHETHKMRPDRIKKHGRMNKTHTFLHSGEQTLAWNSQRKLVITHLSMGMNMLMLIHAPVSRKVFQFFDCDQIGAEEWSQSFLRADYTIQCATGQKYLSSYLLFMPFVLVVFVGFTSFLPGFLGGYFYNNRDELYSPKVIVKIGWLYNRHPMGAEFWELFELIRKLILTGVIVFFPRHPTVRACFCLLVCFASTATLNYVRPHKNSLVFWVEQLGYSAALLLFIAGIMFSESVQLGERDAETVGFLTIGLFMIFGILSMIAVVATIVQVKSQAEVAVSLLKNRTPNRLHTNKGNEGELKLKRSTSQMNRGKFMRRTSAAAVKANNELKIKKKAHLDTMMADIIEAKQDPLDVKPREGKTHEGKATMSKEEEFQRKLGDAFSDGRGGKGEVGHSDDQKWDHESHDFHDDFLLEHGFQQPKIEAPSLDHVDLPDHLDLPEFVHHDLDFGALLNTAKITAKTAGSAPDPSSETRKEQELVQSMHQVKKTTVAAERSLSRLQARKNGVSMHDLAGSDSDDDSDDERVGSNLDTDIPDNLKVAEFVAPLDLDISALEDQKKEAKIPSRRIKAQKTLGITSKKRSSQISRDFEKVQRATASASAQIENHKEQARAKSKELLAARLAKRNSTKKAEKEKETV